MAAPRAPRRRRRHARPGRVAARDRPPARAAPHLAPARTRLEELGKQRETRRKARRRSETPTVALAGYTNVGKSTLLNALTAPTSRSTTASSRRSTRRRAAFEHEGRRYLVTDTVGFIRRLPHQLVEGFAATLEETLVADLVLHVADASAPEERLDEQMRAVEAVLDEIGADELPVELVLNKIDAVDPLAAPAAREPLSRTRCRSRRGPARASTSCAARIAERFADRFEPVRLLVPYAEGGKLAELYALGPPIEEREDRAGRRPHPRAAAAARRAPLRPLPRRRGTVEPPVTR